VYTNARNKTITKGNAPTYERLGKTNNLKLLQIKMNIGGTETDTIQFKLNKSYILSGDETFSPDVISLPPKEPETATTTHNNALEDGTDGKPGFKSWLKSANIVTTQKTFDAEDEKVMLQDEVNKNIYTYTPWDNIKKVDLPKLTFEYKDGKFQEKK